MSVDALMARMKTLSEKQAECSETELSNRFKNVEKQVSPFFNKTNASMYSDNQCGSERLRYSFRKKVR